MDWDRVGAADLYLVLSSFCPASGTVTSVQVFVSEFGKERLEEEARLGPAELRVGQDLEGEGDEVKDVEEDDDTDEEERLLPNARKEKAAEVAAMARVRQYQVSLLFYKILLKKFCKLIVFQRNPHPDSFIIQVNRLKYYYAVAEFDSIETASRWL